MAVDVLGEFSEEHTEEGGKEGTCEVEPLGAKVISVVELSSFEDGEEESVDHIAEEVRLLGVLTLGHRDMREHLLLEDLLGVVDSTVTSKGGDGTATADEVERDLSRSVSKGYKDPSSDAPRREVVYSRRCFG